MKPFGAYTLLVGSPFVAGLPACVVVAGDLRVSSRPSVSIAAAVLFSLTCPPRASVRPESGGVVSRVSVVVPTLTSISVGSWIWNSFGLVLSESPFSLFLYPGIGPISPWSPSVFPTLLPVCLRRSWAVLFLRRLTPPSVPPYRRESVSDVFEGFFLGSRLGANSGLLQDRFSFCSTSFDPCVSSHLQIFRCEAAVFFDFFGDAGC